MKYFYSMVLKRLGDMFAAIVLLVLLSPIWFIVLVVLTFINQGKPFFFQVRPGFKAKPFLLMKFKTMNDKKDKDGNLLPDRDRITAFGSLVRKLSIDEIPQMVNVLKGDMSLIGPRPLLLKYLPLYSAEQFRRHEVRPGISGWAQVNGRNLLKWDEKFKLDVWYVDNISFLLDIKIILLTVKKIIVREGINQSSSETMKPFTGN